MRRLASKRNPLGQSRGPTGGAPAIDVFVTYDAYIVEAELPGCVLSDIRLTVEDGQLTIAVTRTRAPGPERTLTYAFRERRFGALCRTIALPGATPAKIASTLADGVLTLVIGRHKLDAPDYS